MPLLVPFGLFVVLAAVLVALVVAMRRRSAAVGAAEARRDILAARALNVRAHVRELAALPILDAPPAVRTDVRDAEGEAPRPDLLRADAERRPAGARRAHTTRLPRPASDSFPPARP